MERKGGADYLEDDKGLDFLIPLHNFMHRICFKAIFYFLVRHFRDAKYVKDNINTEDEWKKTLTSFLSQVNLEGKDKNRKEVREGKNKGKQQRQQQQQPLMSLQPCSKQQQQPLFSSYHQPFKQHMQLHQQASTSYQSNLHKHWQQFQQQQPLLSSCPLISRQQHCHFQQSFVNSKYQQSLGWKCSQSLQHQKQQQSPQLCPKSQQDCINHLSLSTSQQHRQSTEHSKRQQNQNCSSQVTQSTSHHQQRQQNHSFHHCQRSQQNYPSQRTGQHHKNQQRLCSRSQQSCPDQGTGHHQPGTQGQLSAKTTNSLEHRQQYDVQNIEQNKEILNSVTVGDLIHGSDACKELEKLDINFVLNFVLNKLIAFPLDQELLQAICSMKDVRKVLVHSKYHFTEDDFNENLSTLNDAVDVLYRRLALNQMELQQSVAVCHQDAKSGNKALIILGQLASEAHKKYIPPDSNFVPPDITILQTSGKEIIKDLNKFIEGQKDDQNLIVLSGEHREEKAQLLESLASTFKGHRKFRLVVHMNERNRRHYHSQLTCTKSTSEHSAITLQDQVFACLTHLAPDTVYQNGLDSVKAAISACQKDILFLINWNINELGSVRSKVEDGTWVLTYEGKVPPLVDWKVLRLELYTQAQVLKMIDSHPSRSFLKSCYDSFDNKDILSSLNMIQIFWEVCGGVSMRTDFEVVERYVEKTLVHCGDNRHTTEQNEEDMLRLGEAAFSIYKIGFISKNIDIRQYVCESFLCPVQGKGWAFKHSNVRDFMAAKYVIANPSEACNKWVKENVAFKRVFKFACFMWYRSYSEREYLPHVEAFLRLLLNVPVKEMKKMSSQIKKMEKNPFDSWDLLLELDEAFAGKVSIMKYLMSILSDIPCWCFNAAECVGLDKKLTRLGKVLKWATLDKDNPLIIQLKTSTNMKLITEFWRKLKQMGTMYGCVSIMVTIDEGEDSSQIPRNDVEEFFKTVSDTQVPLHIKRYKGPLFSSSVSKFLKCMCLQNLEILEVCVNDVSSIQEVMSSGAKEMHVRINLKSSEQSNFTPSSIEIPLGVSVYIVIEYFHNIQQLLDGFKGCQHLHSLSIHGLHIPPGFKLNLSAFSQLESLNIRFETETVDRRPLAPDERMEVGEGSGDRLPRCIWLCQLLLHLVLPEKLKRLLLRNIDFFSDSNQCLIKNLFQKYNVKRFVILDTRLSHTGARKILWSQTEEEKNQGGRMKLKRIESPDMEELATKKIKLSKEECDKLDGMEVVITTDGRLCFDCCCLPCLCVSKVGYEDGYSTYRSIAELIGNIHGHNVQCFYSFNH